MFFRFVRSCLVSLNKLEVLRPYALPPTESLLDEVNTRICYEERHIKTGS